MADTNDIAETNTIHPGDPNEPWDLLVIGGGTAGLVVTQAVARFGATVLLVEADRMGGECLWTGCVPSKALLAAADLAADARRAHRLGVTTGEVTVDFPAVMRHVRAAIRMIEPVDSAEAVEKTGARVVTGRAVITGSRTATVDGRPVRFRQAVLATGASPLLPAIVGLSESSPLSSHNIWDLDELPERLTVLGAGSQGCEIAQGFARLGSRVTLVHSGPRILPKEDPDAAEILASTLAADGVDIVVDARALAVEAASAATSESGATPGAGATGLSSGGGVGVLVLDDGRRIEHDRIYVSAGRRPNTADLGLERAGVALDERGCVVVDAHLRTTNPRIWAAGDLTGYPQFTHVSYDHATVAAVNAILGVPQSVDTRAIPRVTLTQPEIAAVGEPTDGAADRGLRIVGVSHEHVDRAIAADETRGFTRLVVNRRGIVVGATIVGPRAGESLGEVTLAVGKKLRPRDLLGAIHPYPTYNDGVMNAALADLTSTLAKPGVGLVLRTLSATRRRMLDARDR